MTMPHCTTRPSLLLLGGAGPSPLLRDLTRRAVAAARTRGMRVHLTDTSEGLRAFTEAPELADALSAVDFERPGECVAFARERLAAGERFDVVLGLREFAQVSAAEVSAALGLPGNPPAVIRTIRAKDECRAVLAAAGFRQPAFRLCRDEADVRDFLASAPGPWIVKPRDAMGSTGVARVDTDRAVPGAIAGLASPFIAEQFVTGEEHSVEGVFARGEPLILGITGKQVKPHGFVEIGHVQPALLSTSAQAEAEQTVAAALRTLGVRFGVFHVELWLTGEGVMLGEFHGRVGGDWIHLLLSRTRGTDIYGMVLDDALGGQIPEVPPLSCAAAVRYFTPPPGRVLAIEGFEAVAAHPAVVQAELTVEPGGIIAPVGASEDRVGSIVVSAADAAEATALADELASSVRFVSEPIGGLLGTRDASAGAVDW
jgi:biotin carboxylase